MAWTESDLQKLEKAIASGVRSVEYKTGKVEYNSLSEMMKVRKLIRQSLGLSKSSKRLVMKTSKGIS